jgi:16S rRNA G966 N2-methylase RsmD
VFADPPYADELAGIAGSLARHVATGGLFVLERRSARAPIAPPAGLVPVFEKRYGGTTLTGFRKAPDERGGEPGPDRTTLPSG